MDPNATLALLREAIQAWHRANDAIANHDDPTAVIRARV